MQTATEPSEAVQAAQSDLAEVCRELSSMTGIEMPGLHPADVHTNEPPLFVYGILGGKDVGKTTLINALAEGAISHEAMGIGPGTHVPVVYVHHDDAPVLRDRLAADAGLEFELVTHDRAVLRHVVLVDLPDFDSKRNLPDHARRAAAFKPHLDAFIWVTTVRKIDHPELLRQMISVAPKKENFYCVVTFADEVIQSGKDSLDGLRRLCLAKMTQLYFDDYDGENLFAICTLDKRSYDFPALSHRLVRQHSAEEIAARRRRNALRATLANLDLVREHYHLDQATEWTGRLLDDLPQRFGDNVPPSYWEVVTDRVGGLDGPYRRMAARLFSHRIWGWPILSALLFPLSAVVSYLGGRLFFESGSRWTDYHQLADILSVDGLGIETRLRRVASELRAKFLRLHQL
ncbi:MAG: GTPase domain-containing protein, partial [Planctomycetes bacterium]|nr:GTPase domain-containing protein [Planctomycetota bacterium]